MSVETQTPSETLKIFDKNPKWRSEPLEVLTADFFSAHNESNLLLNPAVYEEKDGRLFDPVRKMNIAGTANGDKIEEGINTQLEEWFLNHGSGIGVWISPRGNGIRPYPEEQITIYRIGYELIDLKTFETKKLLFLTSHQFKANLKNPEDLRRFIFTEDDKEKSIFEIINWLKNISEKEVATELSNVSEKKKRAEYYAYRYKSGVSMDQLTYEMTQTEFLGQNPIGCPPNSSGVNISGEFGYEMNFSGEGWHEGSCRVCKNLTWVGPCNICKPCESKF